MAKNPRARAWAEDSAEVLAFARVLHDANYFATDVDPVSLVLDYFEKPWKWSVERARWIKHGRPDGSTLLVGFFDDAEEGADDDA